MGVEKKKPRPFTGPRLFFWIMVPGITILIIRELFNEKLIAAKLKQLERFKRERKARAEAAERRRLPPGQHWTEGFPVLDLGERPPFDPSTWTFRVHGEVERELTLSWAEFTALPKTELVADFHCVTTWSKKDVRWGGVKVAELLALARPTPAAAFVLQRCGEGYTTNTTIHEASAPDALVAWELDGEPLPLEHGGPARMVIPSLYAWKSGKFLSALELAARDRPGFWERRGYHNDADPWKEERHGEPPADDGFADAVRES